MRVHTQGFKEQIKELGREIDSRITYDGNLITSEQLFSISPITNGTILKSTMKQLDFESSIQVPLNTVITYEFGLKVNEEYEYLNYGNYIVYSSEYNEDTKTYSYVCYDSMLNTMKDYISLQNSTFPMTVREYLTNLCLDCGLTFKNAADEFANYNQIIDSDLYANLDYTYRDIFDELSQVTASSICIDSNDMVEVRYIIETNDEIDEEYFKDINVKFGEKYGPVNSIVLSRSAESDNVYLQDEESVATNGLCEIKIIDNQIMNFNNRSDYLPDILEKLNGLEYYVNDFTSTGILYYEFCDRYTAKIGENTYSCVLFNDEPKITQGIVEDIYTEIPEESVTDYTKSDKTDRRINQTYILAKKQEGIVEILTSQVESITNSFGDSYTKEEINQLIQTAQTGLTNTFTQSGGNNIFRNTGLWFENSYEEAQENPYEFWQGRVERKRNDESSSKNSMLLQEGTLIQEQEVVNGIYTVSFVYKKLIELANISVFINDVEYELTQLEKTEFCTGQKNSDEDYIVYPLEVSSNHITIKFVSDTDNALEVWDLMVNKGSEKVVWTQNENETTTDTVNISKGISITSSDLDVQFKANADGIRTLDKNGNELTKFTDKGMTTKEAVVENEANIVGILRQRVEDQIWDSFIG